jgi:hypothetical protein
MRLADTRSCHCGNEVEDVHHVLWECEVYRHERRDLLDNVEVLEVGPVYYSDLVCSEANFRRLRDFAHRWHKIRSGLDRGEGREGDPSRSGQEEDRRGEEDLVSLDQ